MGRVYVLAATALLVAHFIFPDNLGWAKFLTAVFDAGEQRARARWRFVRTERKNTWGCCLTECQSQ